MKQPIRFVLPKYRRGTEVQTPDGRGKIESVRLFDGSGYWYVVNGKAYAQDELK